MALKFVRVMILQTVNRDGNTTKGNVTHIQTKEITAGQT